MTEFGLARDGERELAVHNLKDLSKMSLEFQTFDLESSLRQIEWKFFRHSYKFLPHCLHGDLEDCGQLREAIPTIDEELVGTVLLANQTACAAHPDEACVCTVPGDLCHVRDYTFDLLQFVSGQKDITAEAHNGNYTFELTVTNRAGLITTQKLTVQVDTIPAVAVLHRM